MTGGSVNIEQDQNNRVEKWVSLQTGRIAMGWNLIVQNVIITRISTIGW